MAVRANVRKVTPFERPAKCDNYVKEFNLANRLKYLIYMELLLGINRIRLLDCSRKKYWISQIFTPFLFVALIYLVIFSNARGATAIVLRNTYCVEVLLLSFSASYLQVGKLRRFFKNVSEFDTKLNLENEPISPHAIKTFIFIVIIIAYLVIEYILATIFLHDKEHTAINIIYFGVLIHRSEKLFFCTLLYMVLQRIRILKSHVRKRFLCKETKSKVVTIVTKKIQPISNNVTLHISFLHKAYELLHKTSEDLNASMSFSIIVMLFSSGISTILLLKHVFNRFQTSDNFSFIQAIYLYNIMHCIKLTLLMVIPCYLSNSTFTQVTVIRTILHDALDRKNQGKEERRKIKAFYQLTRDNYFGYVLWGLIKLDMSLPLSYSSLCTTYLVIILQFSKFID